MPPLFTSCRLHATATLSFVFFLATIILFFISIPKHCRAILAVPQLQFAVIADPHVYDPTLGVEGEAFEITMASEIKLLRHSHQLLQTAVRRLAEENVDFVLFPGDLTKDGERSSHLRVADCLDTLQQLGIPAFVVPGNHDISNPHAVRFSEHGISATETTSPTEFRDIYADFGYIQALDQDTHSLSYVVEPVPGYWLLALDSCRYAENIDTPITAGALQSETLHWVAHVLEQARAKRKKVIGFMHHAVVENFPGHADLLPEFIVDDFENISRMLAQSGAPLMFTGHTHVQDATFKVWNDGPYLLDIQTGSLATFPHPYRIVRICGGLMKISSRFMTLPGDFQGLEFTAYSQSFTQTSLKHKAEHMGLSWPLDNIFAKAAWAHMLGDEHPAPETLQTISNLQDSPLHIFQSAGAYLDAIWTDPPPADNDCLVFLPWNMPYSFNVVLNSLYQRIFVQPPGAPQ